MHPIASVGRPRRTISVIRMHPIASVGRPGLPPRGESLGRETGSSPRWARSLTEAQGREPRSGDRVFWEDLRRTRNASPVASLPSRVAQTELVKRPVPFWERALGVLSPLATLSLPALACVRRRPPVPGALARARSDLAPWRRCLGPGSGCAGLWRSAASLPAAPSL